MSAQAPSSSSSQSMPPLSDEGTPISFDGSEASAKKKARRTHARRSCLACRQRKARCELPDLNIPSSHETLPPHLKCHRCSTLHTDCIVWDGDRRAKDGKAPRYGPPIGAASTDTPSLRAVASLSPPSLKSQSHSRGEPISDADQTADQLQKAAKLSLKEDKSRGSKTPKAPASEPKSGCVRTPTSEESKKVFSLPADAVADAFMSYPFDGVNGVDEATSNRRRKAPKGSGVIAAHAKASDGRPDSEGTDGPPGSSEGRQVPLPVEDTRSLRYRRKLASALDRNAAQVCEIFYKSPLYTARAAKYTQGAEDRISNAGPAAPLDRTKLADFACANSFLDPALAEDRDQGDWPAAALFLRQVVSYICNRPNHQPNLLGAIVQRSCVHTVFLTRSRDVCQGLFLMATYEPLDLLMPRPSDDLDETIDHAPGSSQYLAAMNIALSLGLDQCIYRMCAGPSALTSSSPISERLDRLREAALWLSLSNFGVVSAWSSVVPNLASPAPSLVDIEAFQTNIQPIARNPATAHLAGPLTALALRSKFFHRIRTFWSEVSLYELDDTTNLSSVMHHVQSMIEDVNEVSRSTADTMDRFCPSSRPAVTHVLAWNELERSDVVICLCTRLIFNFAIGAASRGAKLSGSTVASGHASDLSGSARLLTAHSRADVFKGFHKASLEVRETTAALYRILMDKCHQLLERASNIIPAHVLKQPQGSENVQPRAVAPFPAHIFSSIGLSVSIFGAAKMLVLASSYTHFGYGRVNACSDDHAQTLRSAITVLSRFDRGDSLSLPAIMVTILNELSRRFETLVRAGQKASEDWLATLPAESPKRFVLHQSQHDVRRGGQAKIEKSDSSTKPPMQSASSFRTYSPLPSKSLLRSNDCADAGDTREPSGSVRERGAGSFPRAPHLGNIGYDRASSSSSPAASHQLPRPQEGSDESVRSASRFNGSGLGNTTSTGGYAEASVVESLSPRRGYQTAFGRSDNLDPQRFERPPSQAPRQQFPWQEPGVASSPVENVWPKPPNQGYTGGSAMPAALDLSAPSSLEYGQALNTLFNEDLEDVLGIDLTKLFADENYCMTAAPANSGDFFGIYDQALGQQDFTSVSLPGQTIPYTEETHNVATMPMSEQPSSAAPNANAAHQQGFTPFGQLQPRPTWLPTQGTESGSNMAPFADPHYQTHYQQQQQYQSPHQQPMNAPSASSWRSAPPQSEGYQRTAQSLYNSSSNSNSNHNHNHSHDPRQPYYSTPVHQGHSQRAPY